MEWPKRRVVPKNAQTMYMWYCRWRPAWLRMYDSLCIIYIYVIGNGYAHANDEVYVHVAVDV